MPLFTKKKVAKPSPQHNGTTEAESRSRDFNQPNSNPSLSAAERCYEPKRQMRTRSRLSKTLAEFLHDDGALAYFIQFMESTGEKHLVKFWLEAQSFKSAVLMRNKQETIKVPNVKGKSVSFQIEENGTEDKCKTNKTSSEEDAWHIYQKYLAKEAPCPVGVSDSICEKILENLSNKERLLEPECFESAQAFVLNRMETNCFANFLRSSFHCKHQVDMLTTDQVFLADILYNDSTLFYFMEFMEQEGVRHLVDFLLMADNFRTHLLDQTLNDSDQAQSDAMVIYDKYFSLQATSPLGLSDALRFELEANICHEDGLQADCFVKPVMILLQYIEKTYLPQFLSSQLYFKYLSECIVTIQTTGLVQGHRKRSGSDSSSSEMSSLSQQTQNTLLAMDSKQGNKRQIKNIPDQDMRIDTGQFEPDTLWRRNMSGKLQMAHVDQYGKLISEFEPEPEKKIGSKLTQAVRKLVNWEADKSQETMAWQVAEMIVKDVCSITLGQPSMGKVDL